VRERLIAHAVHERALSAPLPDGHSEREHLQAAARNPGPAGAIARERLRGPGLPPEVAYLWDWFLELDSARTSNGFGLNPIGYTELAAWAALTGRSPLPWEVRWLMALDRARLAEPKGRR